MTAFPASRRAMGPAVWRPGVGSQTNPVPRLGRNRALCKPGSCPPTCMAYSSAPFPIFWEATLTPSARMSPKPSRLMIFSSMAIMASALPQVSSIPSVSVLAITPFSKHSMAKASTPPAEMVSRPLRLHISFILMIDNRSSFMHMVPNAPTVSYSGLWASATG